MRELATASLKLHASFSEEGLATTFSNRGILIAAETPEGLASLVAEGSANAQAGLRTEELDGAEARSLEALRMGPEHVVEDEQMVVPELLGRLRVVPNGDGIVADLGLGEDYA